MELKKTLAEIDTMDSAEFTLWKVYASTEGLPQQRLEAILAMSGSYVGGCLGGKAKPTDLIPHERKILSFSEGMKHVRGWVNGMRIAKEKRDKKRKVN